MIGVLGFDSRRGLGISVFTTASRTALGPTKPPIQLVQGCLSLGVKWPGRGTDHSSPSSAEVKEWVELYLYSPKTPSWRDAQLKHRDSFTFTFTFTSILHAGCSVLWYQPSGPFRVTRIPELWSRWDPGTVHVKWWDSGTFASLLFCQTAECIYASN
jgi:hypothetical protein